MATYIVHCDKFKVDEDEMKSLCSYIPSRFLKHFEFKKEGAKETALEDKVLAIVLPGDNEETDVWMSASDIAEKVNAAPEAVGRILAKNEFPFKMKRMPHVSKLVNIPKKVYLCKICQADGF